VPGVRVRVLADAGRAGPAAGGRGGGVRGVRGEIGGRGGRVMPQKTGIEWTDFSSQLIRYRDADGKDVWACAKVSPGCAHCYSEAIAERFGRGGPFTLPVVRSVTPYFAEDEARKILRSKQLSGRRVFVGDMTDVFGAWVPDELLDRMFAVFACRPDVSFQVLTKRPDRLAAYVGGPDRRHTVWDACAELLDIGIGRLGGAGLRDFVNRVDANHHLDPLWPLPNVHLGTSVEDQRRADERVPHLLRAPAAVRFLSCEPLLGPVDVSKWLRQTSHYHLCLCVSGALKNNDFAGLTDDGGNPLDAAQAKAELQALRGKGINLVPSGGCDNFDPYEHGCRGHENPRIHWLICGGESGPGARPMNVEWAKSLVAQCKAAGVPAFVKQLGANVVTHGCTGPGEHWPRDDWAGELVELPGGQSLGWRVRLRDRKGGSPAEWPEDLRVRDFPTPSPAVEA
jgi:protein gp37